MLVSAQQDRKYYSPSPIYVPSYSEVAPALTDSLVLAPEQVDWDGVKQKE